MFTVSFIATVLLYVGVSVSVLVMVYQALSCLCLKQHVYRNTFHTDIAWRVVGFYVSTSVCILGVYVLVNIPTLIK